MSSGLILGDWFIVLKRNAYNMKKKKKNEAYRKISLVFK